MSPRGSTNNREMLFSPPKQMGATGMNKKRLGVQDHNAQGKLTSLIGYIGGQNADKSPRGSFADRARLSLNKPVSRDNSQ